MANDVLDFKAGATKFRPLKELRESKALFERFIMDPGVLEVFSNLLSGNYANVLKAQGIAVHVQISVVRDGD